MALSSMTGFARHAFEADGTPFAWEVKSVNGRGLDVRLRVPPGLDHLERDVRALFRDRLARGSCVVSLQREGESVASQMAVDEEALALVIAAARRLASVEGVGMPSADGLLALPGVLRGRNDLRTPDDDGAAERLRDAAILAALDAALDALVASRGEEGERLGTILDEQLSAIADLVGRAADIAAEAPDILRQRIREQVELLTTAAGGLDPERLHQEALIAATRADVREELDRLRAHVGAARTLLEAGGTVGRRLDFLSQEFNREANTLCSKAFDRRLTTVGMELKAVIDQMREQVQNLE